MSSGGGGQSGETRYNWNPFMENMWAGGIDGNLGVLNRATSTLNNPYEQYTGQRVAGINDDQVDARNVIRNTALGTNAADTIAAREQNRASAAGQYLSGPNSNPWAVAYSGELGMNPYGTNTQAMGINPFASASNLQAGQNQYAGDNPYFRQTMQSGMDDITNAYQRGTAADTRSAFNRAGAFGGSANQQAVADNQSGLARNLSRYANEMGQGQYDRTAQLREADIGRQMGAGQFNIGNQIGAYENLAQRDLQNQQFGAGNQVQGYENLAQRNLQNQQFNLNRGTQTWENERNRMLQGANQGLGGQGLSFEAARQLQGVGDFGRSYQQQLLDQQYGDWTGQQNWERNNIDWFSNLLGRAQGSTGASTTSTSGYGGNPISQIAGLGLLGRSAGLY